MADQPSQQIETLIALKDTISDRATRDAINAACNALNELARLEQLERQIEERDD